MLEAVERTQLSSYCIEQSFYEIESALEVFLYFLAWSALEVFKNKNQEGMRHLTTSEAQEVEEDLIKAIEKAQGYLERVKNRPSISLEQRFFQLEYSVVSPLYYRLEKHLLDWCTKEHEVQLSKYGQYRIENNLKYNDIPPLKLFRDDLLHQLTSLEERSGDVPRD